MALLLEYGSVSPVPPKVDPGDCVCCGRKSSARWIIRLSGSDELWCGKCFLYETEWAKINAQNRDRLVEEVERELKSTITDGGILTDDGADRILMSTVMLAAYRAGVKRAKNNGT